MASQKVLRVRLRHLFDILPGSMKMRQLLVWHVCLEVASRSDARVHWLRCVKTGVGLLELDLTKVSVTTCFSNLVLND